MVEWSHQIRDVLQRSSAQPLLRGLHPGPLVELNFWRDRRADLESVMDQVHTYVLCVCVCVCACVRACVRACVHACVRVCALLYKYVDMPTSPT